MKHQFKLQPSVTLLMAMILLHSGTLLICCALVSHFWIKGGLIILLFLHCNFTMRRYIFLSHHTIKEFWQHSSDGLYAVSNNLGKVSLATIKYPIFASTYLIVINFAVLHGKGSINVHIFRDTLPKDDFRKLQILLRTMKRKQNLLSETLQT